MGVLTCTGHSSFCHKEKEKLYMGINNKNCI